MCKRLFDISLSFIGLIFLTPLLLSIAILIKVKSKGPAIFRQKRVGRNGKVFTIYKFRTMVTNHNGGTVSIRGETRITKLGAKLRKYKLDEIPELWNVLKGDMTFVGPRPDVPEYVNTLTGKERLILNLRPGITSPASLKYSKEEDLLASAPDPVRFYNEIIWPDKVRINLEYYYNRSCIGDFKIILHTMSKLFN